MDTHIRFESQPIFKIKKNKFYDNNDNKKHSRPNNGYVGTFKPNSIL